jgi:hypothetical protein
MSQNAVQRSAQSGPIATRFKRAAVTPGSITTLQTVDVDFAMAGAAVGDVAAVSFNTKPTDGILVGAPYIAVAGHVRIPFINITAGTLVQGAITANVSLAKKL